MTKYLVLVVVIVIILIFSSYRCGHSQAETNLLPGFWESDNSFNKESGLSIFTLYIGDKCDGKYPAYLLMVEAGDDQTLLINEPTSFTLSEPYMNMFSRADYKKMFLRFINLETELIPNVLTMKFYPQTSKIVLADHKKIYAVFYKNPVLSEMERIKKEKELCTPKKLSADISTDGDTDSDDNMCDVE